MPMTREGRSLPATASVARAASSSMLALDVNVWSTREWSDGLQVDALRDLDTLSVRTRNSTYEITIVRPTTGEVLVRGPNLFLEYLNRPDATRAAFRDGWFATGDIAGRDPDGSIRIVGRRATDLIKTGGFKVGAGEVEAALLEHPGVVEVAVTGEPDDRLGERIVAWVVPRGAAPSLRELQDVVSERLAPHKRPREVLFLEVLPRNDMGKVVKGDLPRDRAGRHST